MPHVERRILRYAVLPLVLLGLPQVGHAQQQVPETHTVRKGDTLWDLAQQYLGDPFLWPEIYRLNTDVVEDPHWIYPDEVLRLRGGPEVAAVPSPEAAPADTAAAPLGAPSGEPADSQAVQVVIEGPEAGDQAQMPAEDANAEAEYRPMAVRRVVNEEPAVLNPLILEDPEPIHPSEYYSAGFLTENQDLPFGQVLGPVSPSDIQAGASAMTLYKRLGLRPPTRGAYRVGDSLLSVSLDREVQGYGRVVIPSGMLRVVEVSASQATAEVVEVYGGIRHGQRVLPLPPFNNPGKAEPVPVADGIEAKVLANRGHVDLTEPLHILFLDKGREEGVALGDVFEVRRTPENRDPLADTVDEVMATVQVVYVGPHTASAQVQNVVSPDIPVGMRARQIARLP